MASFEPRAYEYQTQLTWKANHKGTARVENFPEIHIDCPREFGGEGKDWTPEHLLVAAVENCIMTTFAAMLEKRNMRIASYSSTAVGKAQLVDGVFRFSEIAVKPAVSIPEDADAKEILEILHRAHKRCMVSNSLLAKVKLEPTVKRVEHKA